MQHLENAHFHYSCSRGDFFIFIFFLSVSLSKMMHVSVYLQPDRLFPKPGLFSIMFYVFLLLNQSDA